VTTLAVLQTLVAQGESETLELERSTAELKRAGETLCAFPNGEGGKVPIGVAPDGRLVGQEVADITLRDIAAMLGRFERPARVEMSRVDVGSGRQVIVLEAVPSRQFAPFVFESKPYKRMGSTTTVMSQGEYARLLSIATAAARTRSMTPSSPRPKASLATSSTSIGPRAAAGPVEVPRVGSGSAGVISPT
jgi:ATP-dependent DNA helicase RecG